MTVAAAGVCTCVHARAEHRNGRGRCQQRECRCLFAPRPGRRVEYEERFAELVAPSAAIDPRAVVCWFSVPGEPVPKARPRFDTRHGRTYTPATTVDAEQRIGQYLKTAYPHLEPCRDPVGLRLRFYLKGTGRGDWDNYGKLVSDSLNGKAFADDKQVRNADVDLIEKSSEPRTDILVYRLAEWLL